MSTTLLPQSFWFRLAVPCRRIDEIPRGDARSGLLSHPEASVLPDISALEGGPPSWARVMLAWNPQGISISVEAEFGKPVRSAGNQPEEFANVQIWIDTRDSRNVSRATRFCHRFVAKLSLGRDRYVDLEVAQRPIVRAIADAPMSRPETFQTTAQLTAGGWSLDWFIPAQALHGFDPDTNRRLGFAYQVMDFKHEAKSFPVGHELPLGENPSLWSTLELVD